MTDKDAESSTSEQGGADVPTPTEQMLTSIISQRLKKKNIDVNSDFIGLGGQSIMAIGVINQARAALGVEIPLQLLLDGKTTLRSLSEEIDITNANSRDVDES